MLIIKIIFHYQVRYNTCIFFNNEREQMRNKSKNNDYFLFRNKKKG